ncbi:hypothetical protein C8Q75DRAFT_807146 [Abortiporus biennis]|nr:hypothetical protein C8Q75DRAFT_807146 [Abortiporus biennis]
MVADFVSADYGWLRAPDGSTSARVFFCAGKNWDGYFTHEDVLKHAQTAMDILEKHYPNEDHILVFDNAPTHLKRSDGSLLAWKMTRNVTKSFSVPFGVEVNVIGSNGHPIFSCQSRRFMEAYRKGVNGRQAIYADKQYRGHRHLPGDLMEILDREGIL